MNNHDQHGNHFPDHNHLQHWPSDAYGDDRPVSGGLTLPWPRIGLGAAILAVVIALAIIPALLVGHARTPQSAAQEKAIQTETRARMARILKQLQQKQKGENRR